MSISMAEVIGVINIAVIGLLVCSNMFLVLERLFKIFFYRRKLKFNKEKYSRTLESNALNFDIEKDNSVRNILNNNNDVTNKKNVLCIKIAYLPLVEVVVNLIKENNIKKLKAYKTISRLNICEDGIVYTRAYYIRKYSIVVWIFLLMNILSLGIICYSNKKVYINQLINNKYISLPAYGEKSKQVELDIDIIDKNGNVKESVLDIEIQPNRLNIFDETKLINQVKDEIHKKVLNKNKSHDRVQTSINLINKVNIDNNISITWKMDDLGIFDYKGNINFSYFDKKDVDHVYVTITAIIKYFEHNYEYPIELRVYKKEEDNDTKILNTIQEEIKKLNGVYNLEGTLELPSKVGDYNIIYSEKQKNDTYEKWIGVMLLGSVCILIVIKYKDKDFNRDIIDKNEQLIMYYGEIVSKIKILVIAGLTIEGAFEKICIDYLKEKEKTNTINYAYEEILYTYRDIEVGTSTIGALNNLGKRIGLGPYIRLSSLLIQNIKNGTDNFIDSLELEVKTLESSREETYVKKGGKLGAKLLLPMMIMMAITLVIVMLPALITM